MNDKAKHVAAMLACPHQWGAKKNVTLVDGNKKRDGILTTCTSCGTHRVIYPDGTGTLISPDGISDKP